MLPENCAEIGDCCIAGGFIKLSEKDTWVAEDGVKTEKFDGCCLWLYISFTGVIG